MLGLHEGRLDLLDLDAFHETAATARRAISEGDWSGALTAADEALALWRGSLLADLADEEWVRTEAAGPDELRLEVREARVTALLALDRTSPALLEAREILAGHPLRERARWLELLSLHRDGRTADALAAYRAHAQALDEELGLEPGAELRDLQTAIPRQDPALAAWPRTPRWTGASDLQTPAAEAPAPEAVGEGSGIVGRVREGELIDGLVADVGRGATRWLALTGPAGIGKSRLAAELAARLERVGGRQVWARCPEEDGAPAWWPVRQLVRGLGGDPDVVLTPPAGVDPDEARFAVFERVLGVVEASTTGDGPLALVVDDVQWADPASLRCLAYLAGSLGDRGDRRGLVVVVTLRDGEAGPETEDDVTRLLGSLARTAGGRQVAVPPLAPDEVGLLAEQVAGEEFSGAQAAELALRTGGNPLFVTEYARLPPQERLGGAVPVAVRSVLGQRLAGLDPAVLQVLRAAAVLGDVLEVDVLAELTGLDLDPLADHLDEAADEHILVVAPGTGGYAFAHGLLREEVLAGMAPLRRQRLHARAAEVLAGRGAQDGDRLNRRARHLIAALPLVDPAEVLAACTAAARDATDRWSSETAAGWWQAALGAFDLLPAAARDATERDDLLVARLDALVRAGRGQTVLDVVADGLLDAVRDGRTATAGRLAATLLRSTGAWPWTVYGEEPGPLVERLAAVEPLLAGDPGAHARVLAVLAVGRCYDLDATVPDRLSARALEIAEDLGDADVIADALLGRAYTYIGVSGHAEEAVDLLTRLTSLPHTSSRLDAVLAAAMLAMTHLNLGDVAAAAEDVRQGILGSELLRLPVIRVQMRWMEGELAQWRGDFDRAVNEFATAAQIHRETELYALGTTDIAHHTLLWQRGRTAELPASTLVEPLVWAAARAAAHGDGARTAAHLAADLGLTVPARELLDRLRPHLGRIANIGQVGVVGSVSSASARLHLLLGETGRARELLRDSLALARRTGGLPTELSCRLQLARLAADPAELAAVHREAERVGMEHVARAAAVLP